MHFGQLGPPEQTVRLLSKHMEAFGVSGIKNGKLLCIDATSVHGGLGPGDHTSQYTYMHACNSHPRLARPACGSLEDDEKVVRLARAS